MNNDSNNKDLNNNNNKDGDCDGEASETKCIFGECIGYECSNENERNTVCGICIDSLLKIGNCSREYVREIKRDIFENDNTDIDDTECYMCFRTRKFTFNIVCCDVHNGWLQNGGDYSTDNGDYSDSESESEIDYINK